MQFPKFGFIPWLLLGAAPVVAQTNAGDLSPTPSPPFKLAKVAQFNLPWRIAFLPDGRMLITEKIGKLFLATPSGDKLEVTGVPPVLYANQNGLLGVELPPFHGHLIVLTEGVRDAQSQTALPGAISRADGRVGSRRQEACGACQRIWRPRHQHSELGTHDR